MEIPDIDLHTVVNTVAGLGAANWGLQEVAGTNLVTDTLGMGDPAVAYLAIGAAGVVMLTETFEVTDVYDEP